MVISRMQDPALVAGFYEAAADATCWAPTLAAVCDAFEAPAGLLFHHPEDGRPHILASTNWDGLDLPPYVTAGPRTLEGSGRYRIGEQGSSSALHLLGASVKLDGSARAGVGLHRPMDAPAFGESDRTALDGMARHLAGALRLAAQLETERAANATLGAALDGIRHGMVIATAEGKVVFCNEAAMRMAYEGGLILGDEGGHISCEDGDEAARFASLLRKAAERGEGGCARMTRSGRRAMLAAVVTPLAATETMPSRPLAMVSVRDLADPSDATETHLMDLFNLTAAEAGILPQLLAGDSASLIAQSRGVQVATIRTQAARVLAKTGATNLRALASMVAALG
jgi:DNA-binding CsgD family transcriptional regulator/PAS domain-containing protein